MAPRIGIPASGKERRDDVLTFGSCLVADRRRKSEKRPMSAPRFELRHWPLLIIQLPPGLAVSELRPFYRDWENICRTFGPHLVLFDFRAFDPAFAKRAVRLACQDEVAARRSLFEATIVAEGRIVPHPVMRAIFSAFDWMVGAPWPVRNMTTDVEAVTWMFREADAHSVRIPHEDASVRATLTYGLARAREVRPHESASSTEP